jgi:hypothetical protein
MHSTGVADVAKGALSTKDSEGGEGWLAVAVAVAVDALELQGSAPTD